MTYALCLNCGAEKADGLAACPRCQFTPTHRPDLHRPELDQRFSSPPFARESLRALGAVVERIHGAVADPTLRFWTFICYVSTRVPGILVAEAPTELRAQVEGTLGQLDLPAVTMAVSRVPPPPTPLEAPRLGWMGWTARICVVVLFFVWVAVTWFLE